MGFDQCSLVLPGQFSMKINTMALPGNPYDGHTLATVIPDMEETIGNEIERILADAGYRGHNAPQSHKFRVFTAGQKRRVTPAIKRQMRRRSWQLPGTTSRSCSNGSGSFWRACSHFCSTVERNQFPLRVRLETHV